MKLLRNKKMLFAPAAMIAVLLAMATILASCAAMNKKAGVVVKDAEKTAAPAYEYIVMEKVISDEPGRNRTTEKILVPKATSKEYATGAMEKALADIRRDDPSLKAVIIWAYRTREELNGSNYTIGKIEWSDTGKDFGGQNDLSPNPKIDVVAY